VGRNNYEGKFFPEGLIFMSIPYNLLPGILNNLQDMKWVPHSYTTGRDEHKEKVKGIVEILKQESQVK
jgi:hypothetical protein